MDEPEYENPDIEKLLKNWDKFSSDWQLKKNRKVIDLGKTAFIPDLVLISPQNKKIYLGRSRFLDTEIACKNALPNLTRQIIKTFIIAASHELRGSREEPLWTHENVIFYKSKIEPRALIETAEKLLSRQ